MNKQLKGNAVWHNIGKLLMIVAFSMVFPLLTAAFYRESCGRVFLLMLPVTMGAGWLLVQVFRPAKKDVHLQVKDGAAIVTFGWILAAFFGRSRRCLAVILLSCRPVAAVVRFRV